MTLPKLSMGSDNRTILGKARDVIKIYLITAFIISALVGVIEITGTIKNFKITVSEAVTSPLAQ